jgi:hypothetical protein
MANTGWGTTPSPYRDRHRRGRPSTPSPDGLGDAVDRRELVGYKQVVRDLDAELLLEEADQLGQAQRIHLAIVEEVNIRNVVRWAYQELRPTTCPSGSATSDRFM